MQRRIMKNRALIYIFFLGTALSACSKGSHYDAPEEQADTTVQTKEIKLEDIDNQLKTDQEREDSMKKALGIE
ncbi:MAG: hypothetical protein ACI9JN_002759 [Bacteroidia bacterium]|jgi:hypothetical protein